jgi:7,8-dihydropterin-6-yl-methyl-4-(beta-D-ribofuranosyl)aminobenzene 5'-phosphate synthase
VIVRRSICQYKDAISVINQDLQSLISRGNYRFTAELDSIEQSMAVKIDKGIALVVGCSHPKLARILLTASQFGKVYTIVGGLPGFSDFDLFTDLGLICPVHCTQHKAQIRSLFPGKYIESGAGQIIML